MEFLTKIHLGAVVATMIRELGDWSWQDPFCVILFGFFLVGCIPQFILLRMKWKPWIISLMLGALVIVCDFICMFTGGMVFDVLTLMETFFIAALVGAGLSGALHIFWELFKRRDPEESGKQWLVMDSGKEPKKEEKP